MKNELEYYPNLGKIKFLELRFSLILNESFKSYSDMEINNFYMVRFSDYSTSIIRLQLFEINRIHNKNRIYIPR